MNNEQLLAALTSLSEQIKQHREERSRLVCRILYPDGKLENVQACIMPELNMFVHKNAMYILDDVCYLVPSPYLKDIQMITVGQWEMMTAPAIATAEREIKI